MKSNQIITNVGKLLNGLLIQELRNQGHYLTGALENSINTSMSIETQRKQTIIHGFALDYAVKLNDPQSDQKLPSVKELIKYFLLRGYSSFDAAQFAYLTHKRHLKEGMPTVASKRFSKTGVRIRFIDRVWKSNQQKIDQKMEAGMDDIFNTEVNKQKSEVI